jgi:trans-aconitate methyltransferase
MTWDAKGYDARFSFVTTYGEALVDRLDPQPGEHVLDLGCGTGHLTAEIAQRGAITEGLDPDPQMLSQARAAYPHLAFREADARTFTTGQPVDAVFSNATLHWVPERDQQQVLDRVHRALKPGGRFVAEMGGAGNIAVILAAVAQARTGHGLPELTEPPWCFPTPAEQATRLERAGFRVNSIEHFDRPSALSSSDTVADWVEMFGGHRLLADVPAGQRASFLAEVDRITTTDLQAPDGSWHADYVRLRWYATATSARG